MGGGPPSQKTHQPEYTAAQHFAASMMVDGGASETIVNFTGDELELTAPSSGGGYAPSPTSEVGSAADESCHM